MLIQAHLKWSGATLTYDVSHEEDRIVLTNISQGVSIAAAIRLYAHTHGIFTPNALQDYKELTREETEMLKSASDPAVNLRDFYNGGIVESARAYFPLLFTTAGHIGGVATKKPIALRFDQSFHGESVFDDIVDGLSIGSGPYML